jgi:hypothetical protein
MKSRNYPLIAVVLTLVAFAGCLTTATVIVTAKLAPAADGSSIEIRETSFINGKIVVNLNDNQNFQDYKDNIRNIDNIGFYLEASNYEYTPVTFQLFLEPDTLQNYTDPVMPIDSQVPLILTGLQIPARPQQAATGKVTVTWEESLEYLNEIDLVKETLESGVFSIYPNVVERDAFHISIDSLVIIITLSGEK